MIYAHEGYRFYRVETPQVFLEIELPEDDENMTPADWRKYDRLEDLAEAHVTIVLHSSYRVGWRP